MNKDEFNKLINSIDLYNQSEYNEVVAVLKHNICQNLRIARNLSNLNTDAAALLLNLEPQSLRRIEAEGDRDEISTKVFIMAVMVYNQDANFYFKDWKDNELLLNKQEKNIVQMV